MSKQAEDSRGGAFWIASYPKSGNTWVRLMLSSYLSGGIEVNPNYLPWGMTITDNREREYHSVTPYPLSKLGTIEILMLRQAAILAMMAGSPYRPTIIKTHSANAVLDEVRMFLPRITRGALYVVRDPRDVAVSFSKWTGDDMDVTIETMSTGSSILENLGEESKTVFQFLGHWSEHVKSWLDADQMQVTPVRYEDMLEDPEREARRIIEAIGWDYDARKAKRAVKFTSFDRMQAFEEKNGFHEKPRDVEHPFFREGKTGRWRDSLTPEQAGKIEEDHGDVMKRLKYL